jgi:hypothetical protein
LKRLDGTKPPPKKCFENPIYNADLKTFRGDIVWGKNTFENDARREYKMIFSDDLMKIKSGYVKCYDVSGNLTRTEKFGKDLRYKIARNSS